MLRSHFIILLLLLCTATSMHAQTPTDTLTREGVVSLDELTVVSRRLTTRRVTDAVNGQLITRDELFRAACCNLGESFVTNPSVDVSYSDAATGAKQIRLLGLAGTYVQMLTETMPNFRGAATPFALGYVPGPWMKSIQVSKGTASVKNGYEAMTGQINLQYLQPEDEQGATANLFTSTDARVEVNAEANIHLNKLWSTELLTHYENTWGEHDADHDGFIDQPRVQQVNLQNRWAYLGRTYIMHAGGGILREHRRGGQHDGGLYRTDILTNRYEGYMKHAFVLNPDNGMNIALMTSFAMHQQQAEYGFRNYNVNEKNVFASLMYEVKAATAHELSVGVSFTHDYVGQNLTLNDKVALYEGIGMWLPALGNERENVGGVYAQYTFTGLRHVTLMTGLRVDRSNIHGTFLTPRMHVKWEPSDVFSLRLSAGKGYRTPHAIAENHSLLATGRTIVVADAMNQEEAWNMGGSAAWNIPIGKKTLRLNAEYYYTHFEQQMLIDFDSDPHLLQFVPLEGKSFSHTIQVDASLELLRGLSVTTAYRRNIVKATYGGRLCEKPLNSRYKALFTASYKTPLGLWQADITWQLNGGGRMPTPRMDDDGTPEWRTHFGSYSQLSAQVTRWFNHFSIYAGAENITNYRQRHAVIHADNPWSTHFDTAMVWGPQMGRTLYIGLRLNYGRL